MKLFFTAVDTMLHSITWLHKSICMMMSTFFKRPTAIALACLIYSAGYTNAIPSTAT